MSDAMPPLPESKTPLDAVVTVFGEVRRRIFHSLIAVGIGAGLGIWRSHDLVLILMVPFQGIMGEHRQLYFTAPHESFVAHLVLGIVAGIILAAPYLFLQIWWIAAPRLYRRHRVVFMSFAIVSALTFVVGAVFGYFGIMPAAIDFLVRQFEMKAAFEAVLRIQAFVAFALKLLFAFGVAFELPVLMFLLGRLGIVTARLLWRGFPYAVVLIAVASAVLTPPDILSQVLLAVPLCVLYLIGIGAVALLGKRRSAG